MVEREIDQSELPGLTLADRDIDERDDGAHDFTVPLHRMRPIFDREAAAVDTPELLFVDVNFMTIERGLVNPTFRFRKWTPIRSGGVNQRVHVLADQFGFIATSQNLQASRVGEGTPTFIVDAVNGFTG